MAAPGQNGGGRTDRPAPLVEHLEELRRRIIWSLIASAVGIAVGWVFVGRLYRWLAAQAPQELTALSPTEVFMVQFHMGVIAGLVLASPVILYQIIAFILPALTPQEKRYLFTLLPAGILLFVLGVLFGYFVVFRASLRFFVEFTAASNTQMFLTPRTYFNLILRITVPLGIAFELPVAVYLLAQLGILSGTLLIRLRKFAIVGVLILAAFLSPGPSVIDQLTMAVPLLLLYQLSVWIALWVERRRLRSPAAGGSPAARP
ncbi:MAG: twin-arginine translocase subunit TatC [Firmicutes bacterium]|nr:twin-arginine translocase subunit TatC [Bacillota bacterium]